jgi:hypothetical protein
MWTPQQTVCIFAKGNEVSLSDKLKVCKESLFVILLVRFFIVESVCHLCYVAFLSNIEIENNAKCLYLIS